MCTLEFKGLGLEWSRVYGFIMGIADEALRVHKVMNGCRSNELTVYGSTLPRMPSETVQKGAYKVL